MKIIHKLLLSFLFPALLIALVGYLSVNSSQSALQKSIVEQSVTLIGTLLDEIDRAIYNHIETFEGYTEDLLLRQTVLESNREFEEMGNVQTYIDMREQEWAGAPKREITSFMRELMSKVLSEELVEKLDYYEEKYGYKVYGEVFVTNRYGANIAMTGKTTDYRQDDEEWWQKARSEELYVRDVEYDESAGVYSIDIGIRIDDEQGKFIGVMKVILNLESLMDLLKWPRLDEERRGAFYGGSIKLFTREGKALLSTEEFVLFEDQHEEYVSILGEYGKPNNKDFLILKGDKPGKGERLITHAHSRGFRNFKGFGWFLVNEHETEEIFAPVYQLKKYLTFIFLSMMVFAVLIAIILSRAIARPIRILGAATAEIGKGNLDTEIKVNSNDEVGQLAASFNKMTKDIKETTVSRDILSREVEEHKRAKEKIIQQDKVLNTINMVFLSRLRCETEEELGLACLTIAEELTNSKFGFFGELNNKGLFDTIAISNPGWDRCRLPKDQAALVIKDMPVRGVDRGTMRDGKSRIVNGEEAIASHPDRVESQEGHPKITAFLGVPFKIEGKVVGMIGLGNKEGGYTLEDQSNIEAFSVAMMEAFRSKRGELAVKESERGLREAQRVAHLGSWDLNVVTGELYWSDETYRIFGIKPQDFVPTYEMFEGIVHPGDRERVQQNVDTALSGESDYEIDFRFVRPNGETGWIRCEGEVMRDEQGKPVRFFGTQTDITARKQAETALEKSEYLFRGIFNYMSNGVAIYEAVDNGNDFVFKDLNPSGVRGGQIQRDDIIGKSVRDVFPGVVDLGLFEVFQRVWRTNKPEYHPTSLYQDKKISMWVENYVFKLPSGEVVTVYDDITKHKQAEENIERAKREWEKTFDAMGDLVTLMDKDFRIVRANKATHDLFKVKMGGLYGKHCYELFRGASVPCPNCPMVETLYDQKQHYADNIVHEDLGKIFHVTSAPVFDKDGEFQYLVHVAKDITETKKLEKELIQAYKMEAIGTLAGGIAHDFNNILSVILGYTNLAIEDGPPGSQFLEDLDKVLLAGERAKGLVQQILAFSRQTQIEKVLLSPQPIIKEALKMLRSSIPTTIEIQQNISPDCGAIDADPTQLHQILMNLCTNAFHAMEEKGGILRVELKIADSVPLELTEEEPEAEGDFLKLSVSDTGQGIGPDIIGKIFDPFFTTKDKGKGTGMGLAITYGIVKEYGGAITVDSQLGRGTTFNVYLPQKKQKHVSVSPEEADIPGGKERILFVDDEELLVSMGKEILERLGYQVTAKQGSVEALEAFQDQPDKFDLVITDQTMPNMTGLDLARRILQIRPDIPIILCTGYSNLVNEDVAKGQGIKEFFFKPLTKGTVARLIRQALGEDQSTIH